MWTLNSYVTKSFLFILFGSILILTFGLMGVELVKIFDLISKGIPVGAALKFLMNILPLALSLTIPFGILVSVMLVFGRLSADNEITAMRACGVSIFQIIAPITLFTFLLTCFCLYLQLELGPRFAGDAKDLVIKVGVNQPMAIFEPGRPVSYQNYTFYIDEKLDNNEIRDIQVFVFDKKRDRVRHDITARAGRIDVDTDKQILNIVLKDAIIVNRNYSGVKAGFGRQEQNQKQKQEKPKEKAATDSKETNAKDDDMLKSFANNNDVILYQEELVFPLDYGKKFSLMKIGKRPKYLPFFKLIGRISLLRNSSKDWIETLGKDRQKMITELEIELNKRVALALSPIAFLLLGLPLAIRTSRRETSVGLFLSVILAGAYFISVLIFCSFDSRPEYHPEILLWVPNILFQLFGTFFIYRIARR